MVNDVVISYASEQLEYVNALADELSRLEVSFYFDKNEDAETWGKSLPSHFQEVFGKRGKYCVMCISKHYASKGWPTFEKNVAVMRQINERSEYILPIVFDETRIDGLDPSIKYVSAEKYSPIQLAELIKLKVHGNKFQIENSELPLNEPNSPLDKLRKLNQAGQQRELKRNFLNSEEGIVSALSQARSLVNGFDDWITEVETSVERYFHKAKTHDHRKLVIGYEVFSVLIEFYQKARNTTSDSFLLIGFYYGTYNLSSNSFSSPRRMDGRMKYIHAFPAFLKEYDITCNDENEILWLRNGVEFTNQQLLQELQDWIVEKIKEWDEAGELASQSLR